jgi:hypothetical protein
MRRRPSSVAGSCGKAKLGQLLDAFTDNTLLTDLKMRVTGQSPADEALKQVYGLGERELFAAVLN